MAKQVKKAKTEIATIDCDLITIETDMGEFGFDTANKITPSAQIEETAGVKLVVKGILRAQKQKTSTITGHELKLVDNVLNLELLLILQGGTIIYDPENPDVIVGYDPPVAGSPDKGTVFKLNGYSSQYDASGQIVNYEKITYPNCQGVPIAFNSEDGVFRAPEYTINSAPNTGEAPYNIRYVNALPKLVDQYELGDLDVISKAGAQAGYTAISVAPEKEEYDNKYFYKLAASAEEFPRYGELVVGYSEWNGKDEIQVSSGTIIMIVESDKDSKALAGGSAQIVS